MDDDKTTTEDTTSCKPKYSLKTQLHLDCLVGLTRMASISELSGTQSNRNAGVGIVKSNFNVVTANNQDSLSGNEDDSRGFVGLRNGMSNLLHGQVQKINSMMPHPPSSSSCNSLSAIEKKEQLINEVIYNDNGKLWDELRNEIKKSRGITNACVNDIVQSFAATQDIDDSTHSRARQNMRQRKRDLMVKQHQCGESRSISSLFQTARTRTHQQNQSDNNNGVVSLNRENSLPSMFQPIRDDLNNTSSSRRRLQLKREGSLSNLFQNSNEVQVDSEKCIIGRRGSMHGVVPVPVNNSNKHRRNDSRSSSSSEYTCESSGGLVVPFPTSSTSSDQEKEEDGEENQDTDDCESVDTNGSIWPSSDDSSCNSVNTTGRPLDMNHYHYDSAEASLQLKRSSYKSCDSNDAEGDDDSVLFVPFPSQPRKNMHKTDHALTA